MFLHETGDDSDSFSRQDLSTFNAASSQRSVPSATATTSKLMYQNPTQMYSPNLLVASTAQNIKSEAMSRSDSGSDGPALPTTATWAKNPQIEQSRRSSQAPSRGTPSPKPSTSKLVLLRPDGGSSKTSSETKAKTRNVNPTHSTATTGPESLADPKDPVAIWAGLMKNLAETKFSFKLDRKAFDPHTLAIVDNHPPLFNLNQGVLQIMKRKEREAQAAANVGNSESTAAPNEDDVQFGSGSLQLGGEPEHGDDFLGQRNSRGQTPFGMFNDSQYLDRQATVTNGFVNPALSGRSLTPQQQRNISLLKTGSLHTESSDDQTRGPDASTNQHHSQLSNPFQSQNQQLNTLSRHRHQTSRFNFSPESNFVSGPVKPATNAQMLNQMSQPNNKGFSATQPGMQSTFYSGAQGPPPGLKASGTPPISGGGMFGQGHGFASPMGGASGFSGNVGKNSDENARDLLRHRSSGEAGKREFHSS